LRREVFTLNWIPAIFQKEGQLKEQKGKAVIHCGKVIYYELAAIAGKNEEFVGKLQEKYRIAKKGAR